MEFYAGIFFVGRNRAYKNRLEEKKLHISNNVDIVASSWLWIKGSPPLWKKLHTWTDQVDSAVSKFAFNKQNI